MSKDICVVLPTYEDVESTLHTVSAIILNDISRRINIVIVEDGSIKYPLEPLNLEQIGFTGILIKLSRNLGHQRAIAVGLNYCAEKFPNSNVIVMDSDGEDRPEFLPLLIDGLEDENYDVVVGSRTTRIESFSFKILYFFYKIFFRLLTGKKMNFGNFCALSPEALNRLIRQPEIWMHIGATILNSNLRIKRIPLPRGKRFAGKSKLNKSILIQHGLRSVLVFSDLVSVRIFVVVLGFAGFMCLIDLSQVFFPTWNTNIMFPFWIIPIYLINAILIFLSTGNSKFSDIEGLKDYRIQIGSEAIINFREPENN